jgi:hypothetical protein
MYHANSAELDRNPMQDTGYELRFLRDTYAPGAACAQPLPAMNRVLYCNVGSFKTGGGDNREHDQAWHGANEVTVTAGLDGAEIWRWELAPSDSAPLLDLGRGVRTTLELRGPVDTIEAGNQWLMRCDSVKFPPGGCAFTHTHQGPGIRVLREGAIRIDAEGASHHYKPGEAWFENGPDPVFAQAEEQGCSGFVRVMILPRELKGKSSISYVNDEDRDKPKSQRYKGYVDEFIEH